MADGWGRRRFLKGVLAGSIALGLGDGRALAGISSKDYEAGPAVYAWRRTIFCQVKDAALLKAVERQAESIGCVVFHGRSGYPDLVGVPYFFAVVDRSLAGEEMWQLYLEYRSEVDDDTPCIVVDDLGTEGSWAVDGKMEFAGHGWDAGHICMRIEKECKEVRITGRH